MLKPTASTVEPDRGLRLSSAEQTLCTELLTAEPHCLLLSGSYARGWEHSHSDVDVIVIGTPPQSADPQAETEDEDVVRRVHYVDGRRWEIEYYSLGFTERLIELVRGAAKAADEGHDSASWLGSYELGRALRLLGAVALSGEEHADALRHRLRAAGVAHVVARVAVDTCDAALDDALGLLASGDTHAAVLAASAAVGHAIDACLASHDELWPGAKWRYRKYLSLVERRPDTALALDAEEAWRLLTLADLDPDQADDWVRRAVARCQNLLFDAMETAE
ncbi:nucleotidyltransferase domain-containing protein [Streptomyces sp. NPDC046985]|uniref:nucleotidyltransferase domain-containing protein n=1 Tax=Streptomyces sp. NPDC046985 TaxID=3155377 RepID=UPI00340BEAB2